MGSPYEAGMLKPRTVTVTRGSLSTFTKTQEVTNSGIADIGTRIDYMKEININTNSDVILVAYRGYSDS